MRIRTKGDLEMTMIEFLCELWTCSLLNSTRDKFGNVYQGHFFYEKQHKTLMVKMIDSNEYPSNSIRKLMKTGKCVYCGIDLDFKTACQGDHVVAQFESRNMLWTVPCCKTDNSSKGKKDLIDWWVNHKGYNFADLSGDMVGIFTRAKYRHLKNIGELNNEIPEVYHTALAQIKERMEIKQ